MPLRAFFCYLDPKHISTAVMSSSHEDNEACQIEQSSYIDMAFRPHYGTGKLCRSYEYHE